MKLFTLFALALFYSLQLLAQTPIACYSFRVNANDTAGRNNGMVNVATLSTNSFGNANNAYSFDGVDDFVTTANLVTNQTDNWTMSAWVNLLLSTKLMRQF